MLRLIKARLALRTATRTLFLNGGNPADEIAALAIGLVDSSMSSPPQGGRWLALPTAKYMPSMSCASGFRAYKDAGPAWLLIRVPTQATPATRAFSMQHADGGMQVEATGTNAPRVMRQANNAVPVRALQISFRHERGDSGGVIIRHRKAAKGRANEIAQPDNVDPHGRVAHGCMSKGWDRACITG